MRQRRGRALPWWPGHPATTQWGADDSAAATGTDADLWRAFQHAFAVLEHRIKLFTRLPFDSLDEATVVERLREIGKTAR